MLTTDKIERFYKDVAALSLKFPVAKISEATGYDKSNVSKYLSKKLEPSEAFLDVFYKKFPNSGKNVNRGTSEDQFTAEEPAPDSYLKKRQIIKNGEKKNQVPFYDAEASAGMTETDMTPIHAPAGTIDVGDLLHDSKAAIRIYGNSMLPSYPPGCVLGLVPAEDSFIEPGEVYVIETATRRIFKRLFFKDDNPGDDYIMCYSDNIMKFEGGARDGKLAYPPSMLHKKEIKRLFVVTGVIKRNANSVIINR